MPDDLETVANKSCDTTGNVELLQKIIYITQQTESMYITYPVTTIQFLQKNVITWTTVYYLLRKNTLYNEQS